MAGLSGVSTTGVGNDIVNYLTAVAEHFNVDIVVTSGYRDAAAQAKAMFDNWIKLKRGAVYAVATLPVADRTTLDGHYDKAKDTKATAAERDTAKADFLKLASDVVGTKSKHSSGRALDVAKASVSTKVYNAITRRLTEVDENRDDIYHFQSDGAVPTVGEADRTAWGPAVTAAAQSSASVRYLVEVAAAMPCTCRAA